MPAGSPCSFSEGAPPGKVAILRELFRLTDVAGLVGYCEHILAAHAGERWEPAERGVWAEHDMPPQVRGVTRMADCHPDRKHKAHGLCAPCWQADYRRRQRPA